MNSIFERGIKIRSANISEGGNWIKPGRGRLIVKNLIHNNTGHKGEKFVAEFVVESSTPPQGSSYTNDPGSSVSYVQLFAAHPEVADRNMKTFLYKLLGESDELIDKAASERVKRHLAGDTANGVPLDMIPGKEPFHWTGGHEYGLVLLKLTAPAQPCRGMVIDFETRNATTKKGIEITIPNWTTVAETNGNSSTEIAARRAKLDGK